MRRSQKIRLYPNNEQKTYFEKAFGCCRLAYNWCVKRIDEQLEKGLKINVFELKKEFNALKKDEFPFVYEVTKYATQQPFIQAGHALRKMYDDWKNKIPTKLHYRSKKAFNSFYIGGDQVQISYINKDLPRDLQVKRKKPYLRVPLLGYVKMSENLRYNGKIESVTISKKNGNYYASFEFFIEETPKKDLSLPLVGIDFGIESFLVLSCGIKIILPNFYFKSKKKITRLSRQLERKKHPKTKGDLTPQSNNYKKAKVKLAKAHEKINNQINDYIRKVVNILSEYFDVVSLETLNVKEMLKNKHLSRLISEHSFYKTKLLFANKFCVEFGKFMSSSNAYFPSTKMCSSCGNVKNEMPLSKRIYECDECGLIIDRDYNASLNLKNDCLNQIGKVIPEFTPTDLTALELDFKNQGILTSKVELGIKQNACL